LGDYTKALDDLDYVIGIHHDRLAYFNRGLLYYFNLEDPDKACSDWEESARLGFAQAEEFLAKYCQ
jgi:hypothetical protein